MNKQYSKEEYEKLRAQIIDDMKKRGEWGEFFPPSVSTFGYNESAAQEQFPLTKDEAIAQGFKWEDYPRGTYRKETQIWGKVPDSINDFKTVDISKEIFACVECKKNYLVIPREFAFYQKMQIPLPRLCPDCRHLLRFTARGPNRLWHRTCQCAGRKSEILNPKSETRVYENTAVHFHGNDHCPNEFETSYSPERKEIVYCEQCYNAEVV